MYYTILLVTFVAGLLALYRWARRPRQSWENGPWWLPFIGNLHQFTANPPLQFSKWASVYGSLYTLRFGPQRVLIINDVSIMKQIFWKTASTKRPYSLIFAHIYQTGGPIVTSGRVWQEQRSFFERVLKRFASRPKLERFTVDRVEKMSTLWETEMQETGQVFVGLSLKVLLSNIMWSVITGESDETNVAQLLEDWSISLQKVSRTGVAFFPWLGTIAPDLTGFSEYKRASTKLRELVRKYVASEQEKGHSGDNVISAYLNHAQNATDTQSSFYGRHGLEQSFDSIAALLLAGAETTSATLNWLIFHLVTNQNIQKKVREELENGIDKRNGLSYTEAVIEETLRVSPIAPFGVYHESEDEIVLKELTIPKGIFLVPNIYYCNFDQNVWGKDSHVFKPERFLKPMGTSSSATGLRENVTTFQPGRRVCPGEQVARDVMFLIITQLVTKFEFLPMPGTENETYLDADFGYLSKPKEIPVLIRNRNGCC